MNLRIFRAMKCSSSVWMFLALTSFTATLPSASASCDRPVDPKRVVVFAGMNEAFIERKAAEEGACIRGETFVSLTESLPGEDLAIVAFYEIVRIKHQTERLNARSIEAKCSNTIERGEACAAIDAQQTSLKAAQLEAEKIYNPYWTQLVKESQKKTLGNELRTLLQKLAANDVGLTTIILSGHSTGTSVWGALGKVEFAAVQTAVKESYGGREAFLSDFRQVFLWGCNTMNPFDGGNRWLKAIPGLRVIFGFQGSAPGARNAAAPALLKSSMVAMPKIESITKLADPIPGLKSYFDSLSGITHTIASVYINLPEKGLGYYYERKTKIVNEAGKAPVQTWSSQVLPAMSESQCEAIRSEVNADQAMAQKIFDGETEIPTETGSGFLRDLYTRSRRNETCRRIFGLKITSDQVGYLLFWHDVKKNAARLIENKTKPLVESLAQMVVTEDFSETLRISNLHSVSMREVSLENQAIDIKRIQSEIDDVDALFSFVQDEADDLPWRKRHDRHLRRLARKIKRAKKNVERKHDLTARRDLLLRLKVASGPDLSVKLKEIYDGLNVQREVLEGQKRAAEAAHARLKVTPASSETDASIREKIRNVIQVTDSLRFSEVSGLNYRTLKKKIQGVRAEFWPVIEVVGASVSSHDVRTLVSRIEFNLSIFEKIAVSVVPECMSFEAWHEYVENPSAQARPQSSCIN